MGSYVLAGTTLVLVNFVVPALVYAFLKSLILSIASFLRSVFFCLPFVFPWFLHSMTSTTSPGYAASHVNLKASS